MNNGLLDRIHSVFTGIFFYVKMMIKGDDVMLRKFVILFLFVVLLTACNRNDDYLLSNPRFNSSAELENIWYKIDDYTHGSISFYASEEGYEKMIGRIEAQRNVANEFNSVTIVHEFKGKTFAVLTEV